MVVVACTAVCTTNNYVQCLYNQQQVCRSIAVQLCPLPRKSPYASRSCTVILFERRLGSENKELAKQWQSCSSMRHPTSRPQEQIQQGQDLNVNQTTFQLSFCFQLRKSSTASCSKTKKDDVVQVYGPRRLRDVPSIPSMGKTLGSCQSNLRK